MKLYFTTKGALLRLTAILMLVVCAFACKDDDPEHGGGEEAERELNEIEGVRREVRGAVDEVERQHQEQREEGQDEEVDFRGQKAV